MLVLLLGAGLIYLIIGEVNDALILLLFVFVVVGITFNQEKKTESSGNPKEFVQSTSTSYKEWEP